MKWQGFKIVINEFSKALIFAFKNVIFVKLYFEILKLWIKSKGISKIGGFNLISDDFNDVRGWEWDNER